jgi:Ca2+-binding RTX toxin-like protein
MLDGTADDDIINGRGGNDTLNGQDGNDQLNGDDGDDVLYGARGNDTLHGGAGHDFLIGDADDDILYGDDGNDQFHDLQGANEQYGGDGDDLFYLEGAQTQAVIDGGSGFDVFYLSGQSWAQSILTGADTDFISIVQPSLQSVIHTILDFTPGAFGDAVDLGDADYGIRADSIGWADETDPFAAGFLALAQTEGGVELWWDQNGAVDGAQFIPLLLLQGLQVEDLTAENFWPATTPLPAPEIAIVGVPGL